ncbi:hypothetical protein P0L94_13680 [Microbacter sp. GSS18]|nr:hypothetical protein P0L94_13680 [Microbacter sp. GSS18]
MTHSPDPSWPASPVDLGNPQRCPVCFADVVLPRCGTCGFVFADPRAGQVLSLGRQMIALERERRELIGQVFAAAEAEQRAARERAAAVRAPAAPPIPSRPLEAVHDARTAAVPPRPAPPTPVLSPRRPARRLTVPVLLLIVGVSLVGIAAVFFLTIAWFVAGIAVRALIIGGITLATIAGASLLRRRTLTATAEALAVLGVLLLALDAWAVRANDLFGAAGTDAVVYAGVATLAVAAVCRTWAWYSKLRAPDMASVLALPAGLALLAAGVIELPDGQAVIVGLLGGAAGGLAHALPAPWSAARQPAVPEREVLAWGGIASLTAAAAASLVVAPDIVWVPVWAAPATAAIAGAYTALGSVRRATTALPSASVAVGVASSVGVASIATAGWQLALRSDLAVFALLAGPVVAVAVAVLTDRLRARWRRLLPAAVIASVLAALSAAGSFITWSITGVVTAAATWTMWTTDPLAAPVVEGAWLPLIAAGAITLALPFAPALDRPRLRGVRIAVASALVLAAAWRTGIPIVVVTAAIALAAVALWGLSRPPSRLHSRWAWGVVAGIGAVTAFVAGLASPSLWATGVVTAVLVPVAAALVARPVPRASAALALASIAVATVACLLAPGAIATAAGTTGDLRASLVLLQWVAVATLAIGAWVPLLREVRRAVVVAGVALLAVSLITLLTDSVGLLLPYEQLPVSTLLGEPWAATVRGVLGVAILALIAIGGSRVEGGLRAAAAVLIAGTATAAVSAPIAAAGAADARPAVAAAVALAVCIVGAVLALVRPGADAARLVRTAADAGAPSTAAVLMLQAAPDVSWAVFLLGAAALAAASVTRGWAAPTARAVEGIASAPGTGFPLARAPRRLLSWPAVGVATWAMWRGIDDLPAAADLPIEAYTVAPAVALALFAVALTWLRRHPEAAIAIALSFAVGLVWPTLTGAGAEDPRGIILLAVAALCAGLLAWTRACRLVPASLAGATTALVAVATITLTRGWSADATDAWWLLVLVAAAYGAAAGFARAGAIGQRVFAVVAPALSLAAASITVAFIVLLTDDAGSVAAAAVCILLVLHLGAAAFDAVPLGATTRWTSFAGALVVGATATGLVNGAIEAVSLPLALALLAGAALAMLRRARAGGPWPGPEEVPWLTGILLAVVPTSLASVEGPRVWLGIPAALLAGAGLALTEVAPASRLRARSALLLGLGAVGIGVHATVPTAGWQGVMPLVVAGAGAVGLGAVTVWMRLEGRDVVAPLLAAAGTVVPAIAIAVRGGGELAFTAVVGTVAGAAAVGAAAVLGRAEWVRTAAVTALGAAAIAVAAIGVRFVRVSDPREFGVEPDLWAASAVGIVVAVGVMALRASSSPRVASVAGAGFALATALFAAAEFALLAAAPSDGAATRTAIVMTVLSGAGVVGWLQRRRVGVALAGTAAVAAAVFGAAAFAVGARPVEVVTAAPALGLLLLGALALRRTRSTRSWPALSPGLVLLLLPSLVYDLGESALWRIVALGIVAVATIVVGAVLRLQAPLVIGSVVALAHAVAQLWPWISTAYDAVPWWLWLGIGGALLILLAARYEKNIRALRTAVTAVTTLR